MLGGGGARGIAHLGIIKALQEAGIMVDVVGGTSIGAFVGALVAGYPDYWSMWRHLRDFSARSSSYLHLLSDVTYPYTSLLTGHSLNRSVWKVFGDTCIEDLWLPYFCLTTDITSCRERVHQTGTLWRYCRASMSLAGYFPPLCDGSDGEYGLLLDGGYMNNLPIDKMQSLYPSTSTIIAVDVSKEVNLPSKTYGDSVSGWWIMLRRIFLPSLKHYKLDLG